MKPWEHFKSCPFFVESRRLGEKNRGLPDLVQLFRKKNKIGASRSMWKIPTEPWFLRLKFLGEGRKKHIVTYLASYMHN